MYTDLLFIGGHKPADLLGHTLRFVPTPAPETSPWWHYHHTTLVGEFNFREAVSRTFSDVVFLVRGHVRERSLEYTHEAASGHAYHQ